MFIAVLFLIAPGWKPLQCHLVNAQTDDNLATAGPLLSNKNKKKKKKKISRHQQGCEWPWRAIVLTNKPVTQDRRRVTRTQGNSRDGKTTETDARGSHRGGGWHDGMFWGDGNVPHGGGGRAL